MAIRTIQIGQAPQPAGVRTIDLFGTAPAVEPGLAPQPEPEGFVEGVVTPTLKEFGRGVLATPEAAYSLLEGMIVWPISKIAGAGGLVAGDMDRREEVMAQWLTHKPFMAETEETMGIVGKGFEIAETPQRMAAQDLEAKGYPRVAWVVKLIGDLAMFKIIHATGVKAKAKVIRKSIPKDVPITKEAINQIAEVVPTVKQAAMARIVRARDEGPGFQEFAQRTRPQRPYSPEQAARLQELRRPALPPGQGFELRPETRLRPGAAAERIMREAAPKAPREPEVFYKVGKGKKQVIFKAGEAEVWEPPAVREIRMRDVAAEYAKVKKKAEVSRLLYKKEPVTVREPKVKKEPYQYTAEDLELKPKETKHLVKIAMKQEGKIYAYKVGEKDIFNHADIMVKHGLDPKKVVSGFIDKRGKFVTGMREAKPAPPKKKPAPKGPQTLRGRIMAPDSAGKFGIKIDPKDYNLKELRQDPYVGGTIRQKTGIPLDDLASMLKEEGYPVKSGDHLIELLKTKEAKNIFAPERRDEMAARFVKKAEKELSEYYEDMAPKPKGKGPVAFTKEILKSEKGELDLAPLKEVKPHAEEWIRNARKHFGLTHDLREAGYILTDGKMLDFSGKRLGAGVTARGLRQIDHRELYEVMEKQGQYAGGTEGMFNFMNATEAVRFAYPGSEVNIQINKLPTKAQLKQIDRAIKEGTGQVYYDVYSQAGKRLDSGEMTRGTVAKLQKVFTKAFEPKPEVKPLKWVQEAKELVKRRQTGKISEEVFQKKYRDIKRKYDVPEAPTLEFMGFETAYQTTLKAIKRLRRKRVPRAVSPEWPRAEMGRYETGKIVKHRKKGKDAATGEDLYAPQIYEMEEKIIKATKEPIKTITAEVRIEPAPRTFTQLGPEVKELIYWPVVEGNKRIAIERRMRTKRIKALDRGMSHRNWVNVGVYGIAKQKGGRVRLKNMGYPERKIPTQLSPNEQIAYKAIRREFEILFNRANKARRLSGKQSFPKRANYFTFMHDTPLLERMGFSTGEGKLPILEEQYLRLNTTPFRYAKMRAKIASYPMELNAKTIFEQYSDVATKHIHLSPHIAKGRELLNTFGSKKAGTRWKLAEESPRAAKFITEWLNFQAGQISTGILGKGVDSLLMKVNQNLAFAVLSANARSAIIQPTAILHTAVEIGPKYTLKGIGKIIDPVHVVRNMREAIAKSNHLASRVFDVSVTDALAHIRRGRFGSAKKRAAQVGLLPLQLLDMITAIATWQGAYMKGKQFFKMAEKNAGRYADDVVVRTQASAMPTDITPLQRTAMGKTLSLFNTFVISEWNWILRDVFGIKNPGLPTRAAVIKVLGLMAGITAVNVIYEDYMDLTSPYPGPIRAFSEAREEGKDNIAAIKAAMREMAEVVPIVGGALRYGSHPAGAAFEFAKEIVDKLTDKPWAKPWFVIGGKAGGVPGTQQAHKWIRAKKRGETLYGQVVGAYTQKRKTLGDYYTGEGLGGGIGGL